MGIEREKIGAFRVLVAKDLDSIFFPSVIGG
jgi:hypothetical protein